MPYPYNSTVARLLNWLSRLIDKVRGTHAENRTNIPLLARLTAHLGIIALVIFGLLMSGVEIRAAGASTGPTDDMSDGEAPIVIGSQADMNSIHPGFVLSAPQSGQDAGTTTTAGPAKPRTQVLQYTVGSGDTVTGIAARFHVSSDSILWANAKLQDNPDMLAIGQNLNIPPTSGVLTTVQQGDTVDALAKRYKAKSEDIFNDPFNQDNHDLKDNPPKLAVGNFIMIPGGSKPFVAAKAPAIAGKAPQVAPKGTTNFITPVSACLTQVFWSRHSGVDLAGPKGTPVYAADSGYAAVVGWDNTGYGNMILINHGNGYLTRYGHLSAFNVEPGQAIKKGQLIGRIGSTGHSTGPHLHFEIILNGVFKNPAYYIRIPGWCAGYGGK